MNSKHRFQFTITVNSYQFHTNATNFELYHNGTVIYQNPSPTSGAINKQLVISGSGYETVDNLQKFSFHAKALVITRLGDPEGSVEFDLEELLPPNYENSTTTITGAIVKDLNMRYCTINITFQYTVLAKKIASSFKLLGNISCFFQPKSMKTKINLIGTDCIHLIVAFLGFKSHGSAVRLCKTWYNLICSMKEWYNVFKTGFPNYCIDKVYPKETISSSTVYGMLSSLMNHVPQVLCSTEAFQSRKFLKNNKYVQHKYQFIRLSAFINNKSKFTPEGWIKQGTIQVKRIYDLVLVIALLSANKLKPTPDMMLRMGHYSSNYQYRALNSTNFKITLGEFCLRYLYNNKIVIPNQSDEDVEKAKQRQQIINQMEAQKNATAMAQNHNNIIPFEHRQAARNHKEFYFALSHCIEGEDQDNKPFSPFVYLDAIELANQRFEDMHNKYSESFVQECAKAGITIDPALTRTYQTGSQSGNPDIAPGFFNAGGHFETFKLFFVTYAKEIQCFIVHNKTATEEFLF